MILMPDDPEFELTIARKIHKLAFCRFFVVGKPAMMGCAFHGPANSDASQHNPPVTEGEAKL